MFALLLFSRPTTSTKNSSSSVSEYSLIIGLKTCERLGLIKRIDILEKNPNAEMLRKYDVFEGLGCLEGEHHPYIKPDAVPVIHAPRKVPVAIRDKVKTELIRMEKLGVIVKEEQPTAWVNSMLVVPKKDDIVRICLDPKGLNDALCREHYPMKTVEEIASKLPHAKVFSTLDANCGYWQIQLDDASSKLCTFNTPHGRYRYTRLPFGIMTAPEIFQRTMNQIFEGFEGVEVIMDDILVWGENEKQHDERLERVLQCIQERNIKLNPQKCRFKVDQVKYIGHVLTSEGLKADPQKIEAITSMTKPTSKVELQRFLGMINYLGKFLPNLAQVTAPLRKLLENDIAWHWGKEQDASFEKLQNMVTASPVLQFYDVTIPVLVRTDASKAGVGAVFTAE